MYAGGIFIRFVIYYALLFLEYAFRDILFQDAVGQLEQLFRAEARLALAAVDLRRRHLMLRPVAAAVRVVEQERLKVVHRVSEVRFGRFVRLKFIEKRGKRLLLVIRRSE